MDVTLNSPSEQQALKRLKTILYPDGQEKAREGETLIKVSLDDLADYLAAHPGAKLPRGKPMSCAKCGRQFGGGELRAGYQAGWLCRCCYRLLALAPLSARCVHCKEKIAIDCWRYKLHSVMLDTDGDLRCFYAHTDCEGATKQLSKAA